MLKIRKRIREKYDNIEMKNKLLIMGAIFLVMILFLISVKQDNSNNQVKSNDNAKMFKMLRKIGDIYTVNYTINNEETHTYTNHKAMKVFEINNKTYYYFGNNLYNYNNETVSKSEDKFDLNDYIYYGLDFIKSYLYKSDCHIKSDSEMVCDLKVEDLINTRNKAKGISYRIKDKNIVTFNITHSDTINSINVDYSYVYKVINNVDKKLVYNISIIPTIDYTLAYDKISSYVETNEMNQKVY